MAVFHDFLVVVLVCLGSYTLVVGVNHGWNLLPIFFSNIAAMTWLGQFNFDFTTFLALSGLWLAWRHHFSAGGLVLGVLGFFGGMMVLAPYLLYASYQANGDVRILLLGNTRADN